MVSIIRNLYNSPDLNGDCLTQPLKSYHSFFAKKIHDSKSLERLVWIAGNVATGIFAYPLFGLLAGIGLLVKLTGIPGLKKHNQHMREQIELLEKGIEATKGMFYRRQTFVSYYPGYEPIMDKVFCVSKDKAKEVLPRISQALANYTSQYRKIFNVMETIITNDQSEILIAFAVLIPGTQAKPFPGSL